MSAQVAEPMARIKPKEDAQSETAPIVHPQIDEVLEKHEQLAFVARLRRMSLIDLLGEQAIEYKNFKRLDIAYIMGDEIEKQTIDPALTLSSWKLNQINAVQGEVAQRAVDAKQTGVPLAPNGQVATQTPRTNASALERSGLTDLANAQRLVKRHGQDLCYCDSLGWFIYDGRRWVPDSLSDVKRWAKQTVIAILQEAAQIADDQARAALIKHQRHSESTRALKAMVESAQSEPGIAVASSSFDANPDLFNCLNGTLDLSTGEFREHDRADMLTKLAPVRFEPGAQLDLWDSFLREATGGDETYMKFLQRAAGYSLSGHTTEEKLFFIHGPAAAGKSTFIEALKAMFGDYAMTADFETFLQRSFVGAPRNDIARLAGARFVSSIEVEQGRKLAEGLIKNITGGDTVSARFLHKESFEFLPQFKLWLVANHAPKVRDDDDAIWRRILRLPFEKVVPKEKRDPSIKARLRNPDIAGPAILDWAFVGYQEWQRAGLAVPKLVEESTAAYQTEMDPLGEFIKECCILGPDKEVTRAALRGVYERWSAGDSINSKDFADRIRALGAADAWVARERGWRGIGLLVSATPATPATAKKVF